MVLQDIKEQFTEQQAQIDFSLGEFLQLIF